MKFHNTYIYNTLPLLLSALNNNNFKLLSSNYNFCIDKKFIIGEIVNNKENFNTLRIWKTNVFLNICLEDMKMTNIIGCLDYKINNDNIKIEYLSVRDNFDSELYINDNYLILNDDEAIELKNALIKYIENIAKKNNINKIIIDVNKKLKYYNKYYKDSGFILTERQCDDNPFWIESEKMI